MKSLILNDKVISGFTVIPLKEIKSINQIGRTSYLEIKLHNKESIKVNMHKCEITFE